MIPNHLLTEPPPPAKRYAYCSDTGYMPELAPRVSGVDVLYHEATFLEVDADLAAKTKHSTARQAAQVALEAKAGNLILGHFSTRYKHLDRFLEEAAAIFPNVDLAADGKVFEW
jgi:ribonuclease Z